jgi:hypothetical protein
MSTIALVIDMVGSNRAGLVAALRRLTGDSMAVLLSRIDAGAPVIEKKLYGNDHQDVSQLLRRACEESASLGASIKVIETVGPSPGVPTPVTREVSVEDLLARLVHADAELERQHRLMDQEQQDGG